MFAWDIAYSQFTTPLFILSAPELILNPFVILLIWVGVNANVVILSLL